MTDLTIRTTGFDQLERDWLELAADLGPAKARTTLNRPMRQAIQLVANTIRANTPVDTGRLRDSVNTNAGRARRSELRTGAFSMNDVVVARAGWFWRGQSNWFQALAVEYGTRTQPAQMVLRNALRSNSTAMLQQLSTGIRQAIIRRTARFARTGR